MNCINNCITFKRKGGTTLVNWSKKDRFNSVLSGELADRPPISAWRHFIGREETAKDLAEATIEFQKKYDWDFVKINPRATYFGESWGNTSDYSNYDGNVAEISSFVVQQPEDLDEIKVLDTTLGPFGEQLKATKLIKEGVGEETPVLQTLFSPMSILEYLCGNRTVAGNRPANRTISPLTSMIENHPNKVHRALEVIAKTLAEYVGNAKNSGADGFFYAVMGLARDGYFTSDEYKKYAEPYDLMVLEAASGSSVLLHTCGPNSNPALFKDYPINAIHWADQSKGNPSLLDSLDWIKDKAVMGGVDEEVFKTTQINEISNQALEALQDMRDTPFILAPGCGLPVNTNETTLKKFRDVLK